MATSQKEILITFRGGTLICGDGRDNNDSKDACWVWIMELEMCMRRWTCHEHGEVPKTKTSSLTPRLHEPRPYEIRLTCGRAACAQSTTYASILGGSTNETRISTIQEGACVRVGGIPSATQGRGIRKRPWERTGRLTFVSVVVGA